MQNIKQQSAVDLLIPPKEFHESEVLELKKLLGNPLVVSYLRHLGELDNKDLISLPVLDLDSEAIARRHATIQGRMSAYATILAVSIQGE